MKTLRAGRVKIMLSYNTPYIQESTVKSHNLAPENQLMYKKLPKSPKQNVDYSGVKLITSFAFLKSGPSLLKSVNLSETFVLPVPRLIKAKVKPQGSKSSQKEEKKLFFCAPPVFLLCKLVNSHSI